MKIEKVKIADLKAPERNVRLHNEAQLDAIYKSVKMFGQFRPVIVDEKNVILAGNGLTQACEKHGETEIEVYRMKNLTEIQKKKLMLADNKVFTLGYDNHDIMMEMIKEFDGDFEIPGFDASTLNDLFGNQSDVEEKIQGFGILTEQEKEDMAKARENKEKRIEEAVASFMNPEKSEDAEEENHSRPAEITKTEAVDLGKGKDTTKYSLLCPHCGGRIDL